MDTGSLNKESILDAAENVIRRFGTNKANISDVARIFNVSHAAIYRYYESKTALWNAVTKRWLHRISEPLELIVSMDLPAEEKLRLWLEGLIHAKRDSALRDPEMFAKYAALAESSGEVLEEHLTQLHRQLSGIISEGIENGTFAKADVGKSAQAVLSATSCFHHPSFSAGWGDPEIEQKFEAVFELLCGGLKHRS